MLKELGMGLFPSGLVISDIYLLDAFSPLVLTSYRWRNVKRTCPSEILSLFNTVLRLVVQHAQFLTSFLYAKRICQVNDMLLSLHGKNGNFGF